MKKKLILIILTLLVAITAAGCGKNKDNGTTSSIPDTISSGTESSGIQETEEETKASTAEATETEISEGNANNGTDSNAELLQSASVDIDADGINEEVEALVVRTKGQGEEAGNLEGILRITDGNETKNITFIKKPDGLTGVMTGFEFADLDGDGARDIFLIIPESGAAFSLNYFYAYSYKRNEGYSFTTDSSLSELAAGFVFKYTGEGRLEIKNDAFAFTAALDISDSPGYEKDEESNKSYESSWVEPIPVEIGENSRISLVKPQDGANVIKVPLPIFGRGTVDMVGEVDLYYSVGINFKPVLKSFEVLDFSKGGNKSVGKWNKK